MLFNKSNNGAAELKELTSSYYANNKFPAIKTQIILEEEAMIKLVGQPLYDRANNHYNSASFRKDSPTPEERLNDELVDKLRLPIACRATLRYYQLNIVSHEDTGRKYKINNENEKLPWEWQIDRDDEAQARLGNETADLLFDWLERNRIAEWMSSEQRITSRSLFVNSPTIFMDAYPLIDSSWRFFYLVLPFNKEVQVHHVRKMLGAHYEPLLAYWKGAADQGSSSAGAGIPSETDSELYDQIISYVQKIIPLEVMILASKRLSIQHMPFGVVQHFKSMFQGRDSASIPFDEVIRRYTAQVSSDSGYLKDDLKQLIQNANPDARNYKLLPTQDVTKKYLRT